MLGDAWARRPGRWVMNGALSHFLSFNLSFVPSFNTRPRLAVLECGPARSAPAASREWGAEGRLGAALPPGLGCSVGPLQAHPSWESWARRGQGGAREEGPRGSPPSESQVSGPRPTGVSFQVSDITVLLACAGHTHGGLRTGRLLRLSVSVVFGLRSQNSPLS